MIDFADVFIFTEGTNNNPSDRTRIISPRMPTNGTDKCLKFELHMFGIHSGTIKILDEYGAEIWSFTGTHYESTSSTPHSLPPPFRHPSPLARGQLFLRFLGLDFSRQNEWATITLKLDKTQRVFVVEVSRGGYTLAEDQGDALIDNLEVKEFVAGECEGISTHIYSAKNKNLKPNSIASVG